MPGLSAPSSRSLVDTPPSRRSDTCSLHNSVDGLRPAVGERFVARARVVKPGKSQGFTVCEMYAPAAGAEKRVATGETPLTVVRTDAVA